MRERRRRDCVDDYGPCLFSVCLVCFRSSVNPPANSDETASPRECQHCLQNTSTKHSNILPSTVAQLITVTVIKAVHYLFMPYQKYKVKLSREEVFSRRLTDRVIAQSERKVEVLFGLQ